MFCVQKTIISPIRISVPCEYWQWKCIKNPFCPINDHRWIIYTWTHFIHPSTLMFLLFWKFLILDSQFLINCMTKWIHGWKRNKWMTASKKPVINREDLEALETEINRGGLWSLCWIGLADYLCRIPANLQNLCVPYNRLFLPYLNGT